MGERFDREERVKAMNGIELLFFIFLVALSGIIVGIFIGFGMGQQHTLAEVDRERRRQPRTRSPNGPQWATNVAVRREDVLDAEVLD